MDVGIVWPPAGAQSELLTRLAALIERGGAAHFLDAPVARADDRDFPEPWRPTAAAVEQLLVRLLWLAHVDLDVAIDDLRRFETSDKMLRRSAIAWLATDDGVAHFQIEAIGNDDVAGLLCHQVGLAYAGWLASAAAYRDVEPTTPSERDGSIAAIYLGLGVVATNAALYNRVASKMVGQMSVSETDVIEVGGLAPAEAIYLLAIQAVVRGAPVDAHATLREDLRTALVAAIATLRPHRDAIAAYLGLDLTAPRPPLARDPAPAVPVAARPEPAPVGRFAGERTYRVGDSEANLRAGLGAGVGLLAAALAQAALAPSGLILVATLSAPVLVGAVSGLRVRFDRCVRCSERVPGAATVCSRCGATIAGRLRHAGEFHARELEADDDDDPPAPDDSHATGAPTGR